MVFRAIGTKGWCLTFEYQTQRLAREAWVEATNILHDIGPKHAIGAYRIRLEKTGPSYLVIFGNEDLTAELKERFMQTGRNGIESDISNDVLMKLLVTYEATRDPNKITEVHNLRLQLGE